MNLSISGLLGEVEGSAGRITRQVVQNATDPIKAAGLEIVDATLRPVSRIALGLILKIGLGVVAVVLLLAAIGFGNAALYSALATAMGRPIAGLIVCAAYLVLTAIAIFAMIKIPMMSEAPTALVETGSPRAYARGDDPIAAPQAAPEAAMADIKVSVAEAGPTAYPFPNADDIAAMLAAAGFEREQAGLQAGLALARRMSPVQLALVGAAAGFIGGRRLKKMF